MEYKTQIDNEIVSVSYLKIMPNEETDMHYDTHPQVVIALRGGMITRLEADGSTTDVNFPTENAVFRPAESPDKIHKSANKTEHPIVLMIVKLKKPLIINY